MDLETYINGLGARQRALEKLLAALVLWLAVLSAATVAVVWLWLADVPALSARKSLASLWAQTAGIGALLGTAGCVAALYAAWWLVHTILRRWLDEQPVNRAH